MMFTLIALLGLLVILVLSAFFSCTETAVFSLNTIQLHHLARRHPHTAKRLTAMLAEPTHLLSAILIGNTIANVTASSLAYILAERLVPGYGAIIAIPVMLVLLMVFCELIPKRWGISRTEHLVVFIQPVLFVVTRLLHPLCLILEYLTSFFEHAFTRTRRSLSEDEFMTVVDVSEEEGVLDEAEREMVDGIIRLEETLASEVMTPRVDLVGIDLDATLEANRVKVRSVNFHFVPVYRDSLDNPIGFLDVPRFLLAPESDIAAATIPPFFVPETVPLDTLLATFQREHKRIAFVVDEFGGTAGLITRGDILEEIVSDVDNEYGQEGFEVQKIGENSWLIDGSTSLEEINYQLDLQLEADGADRISGWVTAKMERIPHIGDLVEAQNCRVTVQRARRNRILLVQLEKMATVSPAGEES